MIYLIGGSPRCGKTKVAKELAKKTHIPWFPADYLGSVVFQYITDDEKDTKFPLRAIKNINPSTDFRYSNYSLEQIVEFYDTQAQVVWSGLKAFIEYASHDEQDFIIEGYQITPSLLANLDNDIKKYLRIVFLYKEDVEDIETGIKKNLDPGDWVLNGAKNEDTYVKIAQMVRVYGEKTLKEAKESNMSVFNMDGDFQQKVDGAVKHLDS